MPLGNVIIDVGGGSPTGNMFSIRVYFLEVQQGFAGISLLGTSIRVLKESPKSAFRASGMNIIAENVQVVSVSSSDSKNDVEDTETVVEKRGEQVMDLLGLSTEEEEEEIRERSDLELDEAVYKEIVFIPAMPDEDEQLLVSKASTQTK